MQYCITLEQILIYLGVIFGYTIALSFLVVSRNKSKTDLKIGQIKNAKGDLMKKNFVANMSHEMRTPLNAIIGFSEQLLKSNLHGESRQFSGNIKSSAEQLMHIVNNLFMFSFPDEENIISEQLPFSLSNVIRDIAPVFKQKASEKGIQFFYHLDNPQNDIIIGDARLLRQILYNLYDNSIKFTLHGTVKSSFRLVEEEDKVCLHAIISDTGIGISTVEINSIFNEFHQVDDTITKRFGGVGLGLSICKKLIEEQKGEIKVSSNVGVGTIFELRIPYLKPTHLQQKFLKNAAEAAIILKDKSILIVDDDEYNRLLASKRLELWGAKVTLCKNGTEALIVLAQEKFDAILLDIHMPDISGIEVARILRNQSKNLNNHTPIMAVTATINNDDHIKVFNDTGINDCLTKPYKENELFEKLTMLLSENENPNQNELKPNAIAEQKYYDLEELKAIMKGDDEFLLLMLNTFLKNGKENIVALNNHLQHKEYKMIGEVAHKMLNSYRQLAITQTLFDLEKLEMLFETETPNHNSVVKSIENIKKVSILVFESIENEIVKINIQHI